MAQQFSAGDFSVIPRNPNKLPTPIGSKHIQKFIHWNGSTKSHVISFIEFIFDLNVVPEHVLMQMFVHTLEDECFKRCGQGETSSFVWFTEVFCKY